MKIKKLPKEEQMHDYVYYFNEGFTDVKQLEDQEQEIIKSIKGYIADKKNTKDKSINKKLLEKDIDYLLNFSPERLDMRVDEEKVVVKCEYKCYMEYVYQTCIREKLNKLVNTSNWKNKRNYTVIRNIFEGKTHNNLGNNLANFLEKIKKHRDGNVYNYFYMNYQNNSKDIFIYCKKHGFFNQAPANHIDKRKNHGCQKCGLDKNQEHLIKTENGYTKYTNNQILERFHAKHGNKYIYHMETYTNMNHKMLIECRKHGIFSQKPIDHVANGGCRECGIENGKKKQYLDIQEFISRCEIIQKKLGRKYCYKNIEYNGIQRFIENIYCINHKKYFRQKAVVHQRGNTACKQCVWNSKLEKIIENFLVVKSIKYIQQHKINRCKNIFPLPFDFLIKTKKEFLLEHDGGQHFRISSKFHKTEEQFLECQKRDRIKDVYAFDNNISLIRTSYKCKPREIEEILQESIDKANSNNSTFMRFYVTKNFYFSIDKFIDKIEVKCVGYINDQENSEMTQTIINVYAEAINFMLVKSSKKLCEKMCLHFVEENMIVINT